MLETPPPDVIRGDGSIVAIRTRARGIGAPVTEFTTVPLAAQSAGSEDCANANVAANKNAARIRMRIRLNNNASEAINVTTIFSPPRSAWAAVASLHRARSKPSPEAAPRPRHRALAYAPDRPRFCWLPVRSPLAITTSRVFPSRFRITPNRNCQIIPEAILLPNHEISEIVIGEMRTFFAISRKSPP